MSYAQRDILLVSMVFSNGTGAKKRPVMVVYDSGDDDLLVAPVTSHTARTDHDVRLNEWQKSGLLLPSIVRLEKLATVISPPSSASLDKFLEVTGKSFSQN